jgi:biopolymer transport protein ExbB/TolQ
MVKSGPMVGLLGTVMAMMSAFGKFATTKNVEPGMLAGDIKLALLTTAGGLFIAITMLLSSASINIRVRNMQELIGYGLNQFLEIFKEALIRHPR